MKKIFVCFVLIFCIGVGSLFAADDILTFPSPIKPLSPIINLGLGIGSGYLGYAWGFPPLVGTVDVPVDVGVPLSFGVGVGFDNFWLILSRLSINARVALHLNFGIPGLDIYPVFAIGPLFYIWDTSWWGYDSRATAVDFYWGLAAGLRYFFTDNVGIFAELGYTSLTYITAGVTFTFGGSKGSASSSSRSRRSSSSSSSSSSTRYMRVNADTLNRAHGGELGPEILQGTSIPHTLSRLNPSVKGEM